MMKFFKSPLGIALTAVSAILIASPEARKMTRKLAVKGTAAVLGLADQVRDATSGVRKQLQSVVEEARVESHAPTTLSTTNSLPIKDSFNVFNDDYLKNAYPSPPHHPAD